MKKILVVDDDSNILEVFKDYLDPIPAYQVETAKWASDAEELLMKNHYDLLITDMLMPEINGLELTEFTKKHCPQTKVLACSGGGDSGLLVADLALGQALNEGAETGLEKPFTREELLAKVKHLIGDK